MRFDILSLFPEMFTSGPLKSSIIKRAQDAGIIQIAVTNPRDFTEDRHHIVDDYPFGGGDGMVLKPEPVIKSIQAIKNAKLKCRTLIMSPSGRTLTQTKVKELANYEQLILVCGHYEGIDERVLSYVDEAVSIGDYILTGGELPAMIVIDSVARLLPGVLGSQESFINESFSEGLLEYPQYTRPREYCNKYVPEVLLSGDHAKINRWRRKESLKKTYLYRRDLLKTAKLKPGDGILLAEIFKELAGEKND